MEALCSNAISCGRDGEGDEVGDGKGTVAMRPRGMDGQTAWRYGLLCAIGGPRGEREGAGCTTPLLKTVGKLRTVPKNR